jgi:glycosyltransferase involved in cell wall biosynthesis
LFWTRYTEVFESVRVIARVAEGTPSTRSDVRSDSPAVSFHPVPTYVGPWQYLARWNAVRAAVRHGLTDDGAVILRIGSALANLAWPLLVERGQPYAVEVVGDPWDVFGPGVVQHPLRPFLRRYFRWRLAQQCASAAAAAYVTEHALQRRYPLRQGRSAALASVVLPPDGRCSFVSSDVMISETHPGVPSGASGTDCWRLVFVGSLEQLYKGPDVLLRAMALCRARGLRARLRLVGDGRHRTRLLDLAVGLGIADGVEFLGALPAGDPVYAELMQADLFVLPSRTEGLPRALIEAMAFGLPCLSTRVGGIPELLAEEDLVAPGDVEALAREIIAVLSDPARRARMRERNLRRAADFTEAALAPRRRAFYAHVHDLTKAWLDARSTAREA